MNHITFFTDSALPRISSFQQHIQIILGLSKCKYTYVNVRPLLLFSHIHIKLCSCSLSVVYFTLVLCTHLSSELRAWSCSFM